jgi:hypothetical protein
MQTSMTSPGKSLSLIAPGYKEPRKKETAAAAPWNMMV